MGGTAENPPDEMAEIQSAIDRHHAEYHRLQEHDPRRRPLLLEIGRLVMKRCHQRPYRSQRRNESGHADPPEDAEIDVRALEMLAAHSARRHRYPSALECYFQCVRLLGSSADPTTIGIIWMGVGYVYGGMGWMDRALEYYRRSVDCFRTAANHYLEITALFNMAAVLCRMREFSAALPHLLRCLMVFEELNEPNAVAASLALVGHVHEQMGNIREALSHTRRALAIPGHEENPILHGTLLLSLGSIHHAAGHPDLALTAVERAFEITEDAECGDLRTGLHAAAALLYEQVGNPLQALRHHRHYMELTRRARHTTQHSAREIEARFETERTQCERDAYRLQAEELRREVYDKTRELAAMSLDLVQKNELLGEMRRRLVQMVESPHESPAGVIEPLLSHLTATMRADGGWGPFEDRYNELHHDFIHTLADRFPSLTPTELKICALTRIDLSTKDIASILFVTVRNIQNHRYRIRKKLALHPDINLASFLTGI